MQILPELQLIPLNTLTSALNILAAMITPALLISATGTYILSTTGRLGRVVDRMRLVSEKVEFLSISETAEMRGERIQDYQDQMRRLRARLGLLQNALTMLYLAASTFVLTSVAIGLVALVSIKLYWTPVAMGISGALMLLVASLFLILEARHAVRDLQLESDFLRRLARHHAGTAQSPVEP